MKVENIPEKSLNVQPGSAADAVSSSPAAGVKSAQDFVPGQLTEDLWDKRDLMSSVSKALDNVDTVSVSEEAKRGIVGDPRIVGDENAE